MRPVSGVISVPRLPNFFVIANGKMKDSMCISVYTKRRIVPRRRLKFSSGVVTEQETRKAALFVLQVIQFLSQTISITRRCLLSGGAVISFPIEVVEIPSDEVMLVGGLKSRYLPVKFLSNHL